MGPKVQTVCLPLQYGPEWNSGSERWCSAWFLPSNSRYGCKKKQCLVKTPTNNEQNQQGQKPNTWQQRRSPSHPTSSHQKWSHPEERDHPHPTLPHFASRQTEGPPRFPRQKGTPTSRLAEARCRPSGGTSGAPCACRGAGGASSWGPWRQGS